jgi:hypothetical protein
VRIFISFSSRDREAVRQLDTALRNRRPDLSCFLDERGLTGGVYWIPRLAKELAEADVILLLLGETVGRWQELEYYESLQLSRQSSRDGRPRIIPVVIADRPAPGLAFLSTLHQIFALDPVSPLALSAIEKALDEAPRGEVWEPWKRFQPYKGLPALTETDAAFFFGRDKETADVLDLLAGARGRVVTLIGQSGVGKSSLVLAGVLSRLKSQLPPVKETAWPAGLTDSRSYLQLKMRPGKDPVKELAASLVRLYGTDGPAIEEDAKGWANQFRTGSLLRDMLRLTRDRIAEKQGGFPPKRVVLYVDQAEELYTRAPKDEAQVFSRLLADAAGEETFSILMSLRSDFYPDFQNDAVFGVSDKFDVLALKSDLLVDVIREPANTLGARFQDAGMPGLIADATRREAGALPLLSDLLQEMWLNMQDRGDGVLCWSDQPGILDISLPLKRRADAYMALPTTDHDVMRRLFTLRLAQVAAIGDPVRRRARKSECSPEEWSVAEQLAGPDQRLLTISTSTLGGEPIVEVAHEQLLQRWPRLKSWLDEEREFLIWRTEAEQAAKECAKLGDTQKPEALLMGLRLTNAERWYQRRANDLGSELKSYVEASIDRQQAIIDRQAKEEAEKLATQSRLKDAELELERARADAALEKESTALKREATARRTARVSLATAAVALLSSVGVTVAVAPDLMRRIVPAPFETVMPPPLPDRTPIKAAHWLDQNWSTEERHWFHHASVGAGTFPIPYAWFVALEQPGFSLFEQPGLLSASEYLERFGFIPSPRSAHSDEARRLGYASSQAPPTLTNDVAAVFQRTPVDNLDGLPVGFARTTGAINPATGAQLPDQISLTCAACHTGHLEYKGTSIRFDGGPAMVNLKKLELATGLSIAYTLKVPGRFTRFAARVLGPDAKEAERGSLEQKLASVGQFLLDQHNLYDKTIAGMKTYDGKHPQKDTEEGFGRLDALNRIGNQLFYTDFVLSGLSGYEKNLHAQDAPVSFPPIWTVPWFKWAQYDASIEQPLIRNAGEALGVAAQVNFLPNFSAKDLFRSSVALENLVQIEKMLQGPDPASQNPVGFGGLQPPKWPSSEFFPDDPLWKIKPERVIKGRALYADMCVECHLGPVNDPVFDKEYLAKSFWSSTQWHAKEGWLDPVQMPAADMGTDNGQASVLAFRQVSVPGFLDMQPARDLGMRWECQDLPNYSSTNMPFVIAVMIAVDRTSQRWMDDPDHKVTNPEALWGTRKNCPNTHPESHHRGTGPELYYRARPLNGVWATAPYLHNGSVPSLYWMLKPAAERPTRFCVGARDFDPEQVGFRTLPGEAPACLWGETLFSTTDSNGSAIPGNSNLGHSFEGMPGLVKRGVIGRALSEEEQFDLLEYLKIL